MAVNASVLTRTEATNAFVQPVLPRIMKQETGKNLRSHYSNECCIFFVFQGLLAEKEVLKFRPAMQHCRLSNPRCRHKGPFGSKAARQSDSIQLQPSLHDRPVQFHDHKRQRGLVVRPLRRQESLQRRARGDALIGALAVQNQRHRQ